MSPAVQEVWQLPQTCQIDFSQALISLQEASEEIQDSENGFEGFLTLAQRCHASMRVQMEAMWAVYSNAPNASNAWNLFESHLLDHNSETSCTARLLRGKFMAYGDKEVFWPEDMEAVCKQNLPESATEECFPRRVLAARKILQNLEHINDCADSIKFLPNVRLN